MYSRYASNIAVSAHVCVSHAHTSVRVERPMPVSLDIVRRCIPITFDDLSLDERGEETISLGY